ncbi:MAG: class I SAM-dependent methyltransferase [Nanoarchaeota archaeon]|nr:class I SAM-dependent methyltransferase [Nanoarchaeota archaeon]
MKDKYTRKKAIEKWDAYYSRKSLIPRFVDWVVELYFSRVFESCLKKITKNSKGNIIELGCGSGIMSARLAEKGYDVTVFDISKEALRISNGNFVKNKAKGNFVQGDLLNIQLKPGSFDIVWNQGVIEHFDDITEVVLKMNKLVKKGGYLILFVPAYNSPLHFAYKILTALHLKSLWPFDDQIFLRKSELLRIMLNAKTSSPRVSRVRGSFLFSLAGYSKKE